MYAVMITAHNALSIRRRGSNSSGKKLPVRSFGIPISTSPAGVDNSFPPAQSARLAEALRVGGVDHTIENYVGMDHGWTVPDNGSFNEKGAERHWARLETFFGETL